MQCKWTHLLVRPCRILMTFESTCSWCFQSVEKVVEIFYFNENFRNLTSKIEVKFFCQVNGVNFTEWM